MDRARILTVSLLAVVASLVLACSSSSTGSSQPSSRPATSATGTPLAVAPTPTGQTASPAAATSSGPLPTQAGMAPIVQRDVTYCSPGGVAQKMDVFRSPTSSGKPSPAVIYLHGGAWLEGDKASGVWLAPLVGRLLEEGYVVAAVNYRLAPAHKWPAQIEDAKCAVRYLRANASSLAVDPSRLGVWGVSAGGHLAALLGTTDPSAGLEGDGGYPGESSRVQAVVDIAGPADLTLPGFSVTQKDVAKNVFGAASPQDPVLKKASPVSYISKDDPPFLIIHGDKDATVPPRQSQVLDEQLRAAGVDSTLLVVRDADHTLNPVGSGSNPSQEQIAALVISFFDRHLKK